MEEFLMSLVEGASGTGAYALVFGILTACGLGVPLPEDISLILGGFLAHKGAARLEWMMVTGMAGILVGDSLIFFAGRNLGSRVGRGTGGFFARIITPEKRARVEGLFQKHGEKIVCIARFMPGVRAVTYFTAGSVGMRYLRFIFWDGLAALVSAPVFVFLGYYFGSELDLLIDKLKQGQVRVFGVLGIAIVGYVLVRMLQKRRAARKEAQARAEDEARARAAAALSGRVEVPQTSAGGTAELPSEPGRYEPLSAKPEQTH